VNVKNRVKKYGNIIRHVSYVEKIQQPENSSSGQLMGEIIRNVHSIEKGLSLETPRKLFGYAKIIEMLHLVEQYFKMEDHSNTVILMAYDALKEYLSFHSKEKNDAKIREIQKLMDEVFSGISLPEHEKHGGTYSIKSGHDENVFHEFQSLVNARHSIRDFSNESVPMEELRQAINVAFRCPTACNRQGVRAYILTGKNKDLLSDWVIGIGGFGDKVEKYILITGKLSEYREDEQFQYIVSASIFAGYLTLALEAKNIGCCVVQRPVLLCKKWRELQTQLNIPNDEQIVLMLGVGMKKEDYKVPVSYRLPYDELVKEL